MKLKSIKSTVKTTLENSPILYRVVKAVYRGFLESMNGYQLPLRRAKAFARLLDQQPIHLTSKGELVGKQTDFSFPHHFVNQPGWKEINWNLTPGYLKIIERGFEGIKEEIEDKLQNKLNSKKKDFYRAALITCEVVIRFAEKYAKGAMDRSESCADSTQRKRWAKKAELSKRVPARPARTFLEALQSVHFTHILCWCEGNRYLGLGRLDQYLYPYYQKDLERKIISQKDAEELTIEFFERLNDDIDFRSNHIFGDTGQTIMLGGKDKNGEDATNDLSYVFLDSSIKTQKTVPNLKVRLHSKSPEDFIRKSCELSLLGMGHPTFCNDEVIIPALMKAGYSEEDATEYSVGGCWEPLIPGYSYDYPNVGKVVFLKCLESAINNGKSLLDAHGMGLSHGNLKDYQAFDQLMENLKRQIEHEIEVVVKKANKKRFLPSGLLSILVDDCLKKGKDISEGGARYNNWGILGASLANTADALAAIRSLVYRQNRISRQQLYQALKDDFCKKESLRQMLINKSPKFGDDEDEVDILAKEIGEFYCQKVSEYKTEFGGKFKPALASENGYVETAYGLGASADGRRAKSQYGPNFSPALGQGRLGPTAVINSCAKLDSKLASNSAVTDITLDPFLVSGKDGLDRFVALVKSFIELGGCQIQFNIMNKETLQEAQRYPERYQNLMVRVWGFSSYFVRLPKEYQDNLIARIGN